MQDHDIPDLWMGERAIVWQLLRDDHDPRWTLRELKRKITDMPAWALRDGLARLEREGVAVRLDKQVLVSRCARHLDALELVSDLMSAVNAAFGRRLREVRDERGVSQETLAR